MTEVTIYRNEEDKYIGFESKGHANFRRAGKDIVCAGVSSITQTALLGIQNLTDVKTKVKLDENKGYLKFELDIEDNSQKFYDAQVILKTMLCGLEDLRKQYPKYIKLEDTK